MILALIILSATTLLLLVCLAIACLKLVDLSATVRVQQEFLSKNTDNLYLAQDLVYKKFGYRFPMSEKYLRVEEILHEKGLR